MDGGVEHNGRGADEAGGGGGTGSGGRTGVSAVVGTAEAVEAAVEGIPGALSLAPSSVVPLLGGELVLPSPAKPGARSQVPEGDVAADTVRAGLLQAGPLAIAGVLANGANVIVTILLAHLLKQSTPAMTGILHQATRLVSHQTTHDYGVLNQLTGLFLIVSLPGSAVIVAVVRKLTAWRGSDAMHFTQRWARRVHRRGILVLVGFVVVVVAGGGWLAHFLRQTSPVGVDAILIAAGVWVLLCLDRGLLQSHRSYRALAVNLVVEGGVRSVAMICLVVAGFHAPGAAVGVLVAECVTAVHARFMADRAWQLPVLVERRANPHRSLADRQRRRWRMALRHDPELEAAHGTGGPQVGDLVTALVALAMVALLQNVDVIVVGRLAPSTSGSYAAVSVASKALVFGAIVLGGYLLPEAAIRWKAGGHALRQLGVTLLILAVPALALLGVAIVAPTFLLRTVFSSTYLGAEAAFLPLVLAMVCLSATVVLTMYLLAVGRRWITAVLVLGAGAVSVAVTAAHGKPVPTATADLRVQAVLALVAIVGFGRVHHRRLRPR